jgi:hypothetical protein
MQRSDKNCITRCNLVYIVLLSCCCELSPYKFNTLKNYMTYLLTFMSLIPAVTVKNVWKLCLIP